MKLYNAKKADSIARSWNPLSYQPSGIYVGNWSVTSRAHQNRSIFLVDFWKVSKKSLVAIYAFRGSEFSRLIIAYGCYGAEKVELRFVRLKKFTRGGSMLWLTYTLSRFVSTNGDTGVWLFMKLMILLVGGSADVLAHQTKFIHRKCIRKFAKSLRVSFLKPAFNPFIKELFNFFKQWSKK